MSSSSSVIGNESLRSSLPADASNAQHVKVRHPAHMLLASVPLVLLAGSGAASLIYQVLWIKQLSLVVGVEVHAISVAIAAFFAGLGFGAWWWGARADASPRPMRLFALLEAGVAVLALSATLLLGRAAAPFVALEAQAGVLAWLVLFFIVGLPAALMGGTLPAVLRAVAPRGAEVSRGGGRLYAANTAGAIVGALLASFLLIPALGLTGAAFVAAGINLAVALCALAISVKEMSASETVAEPVAKNAGEGIAQSSVASASARRALALYAVAGGIALGYEVVWSQAIVQFMSTRAFAFSVVLATYLAGLALGSALYSRYADRIKDAWGAFGLLIAGAGLLALVCLAGTGRWLAVAQSHAADMAFAGTGNALASMSARFAVAALFVVFAPTLLLGAAFPAALRLAADAGHAGRDTGRLLACNTLGGIVGSLLVGFVLVPWLGLIHTLALLALGAVVVGAFAVVPTMTKRHRLRFATLAVGAFAVVVAVMTPANHLAELLAQSRGGMLSFYEESRGGTVAVVSQHTGSNNFQRLYINGVSNSGDAMTSQRYMRLQALLPLIIHNGEPKSALVVGLGTGITAGALLSYPGLEKRVVAELLPAVLRAVPNFDGNQKVASDARMDIRLRDGRRELLASAERYDLITLEPPPPSAAGVANLYSSDFYRLAGSRLNVNGIVAQWLPLPTQNDEDSRSLVRSFLDVYPHASLWTTELHEMLLVGSMQPIQLDAQRIAERFAQPEVSSVLREVGVVSPAALLATWVTDRAGLVRYAGDAQPVTDDRPRIEYAAWVRPKEIAKVLPKLIALQAPVPLLGADDALRKAIERERDNLLVFYEAGLYAYAGDRNNWLQSLQYVMRRDGSNAYYRWVAGAP
ncbi:fused MFS/spermidine synthase [Uliginosibacterium sp. H3]|uniref:Fused MFS/spermidine synthase n=1 Tax=Uliginosibacterium silvisoli TaxID=3114758 RepID=A0ABU6K2A5_9RHOO|nr:fused MFS/spermidine synthase [Uliginosibacterium sp. H3]